MIWEPGLVLEKDPDGVLDYGFDWAEWLGTDTISSYVLTLTTGITLAVWLSGGTAGVKYDVACRITTTGGRTDERTVSVRVLER